MMINTNNTLLLTKKIVIKSEPQKTLAKKKINKSFFKFLRIIAFRNFIPKHFEIIFTPD